MRLVTSLAPLVLLLAAPAARAQPFGSCPAPTASDTLSQADVRTPLFNDGSFFRRNFSGDLPSYEVPKGTGIDAVFLASLWVGGTVDNELRFAGADYFEWEFRPGPLAPDGTAPTAASCAAYDRLWRVTLEDVARYNGAGEAAPDLAEWPYEAGAPVVDGDGDAGNYDLAGGDRPAILGDETVWWVMNDRGSQHLWSGSPPVGLEVRATAFTVSAPFAFHRLGFEADAARHVGLATFYRLDLTYPASPYATGPLEDAYVGFYVDPDLGQFNDDYIGSYPEYDVGFVYNADDFDEGSGGYGERPPALGVVMLDGPAEKPLSAFGTFFDGVTDSPANGQEAYQYLQGRWRDGLPFEYGGNGRDGTTGVPTRYLFSDLPPNYWSEYNFDGHGTANTPSDRRFFVSHGPFTMEPGETVTVRFALAWAQWEGPITPIAHIASLNELLIEALPAVVLAGAADPDPGLATITPDQLPPPLPVAPPEPSLPEAYRLDLTARPNPVGPGGGAIHVALPAPTRLRLTVYDALGREVAVLVDGTVEAGVLAVAVPRLAAGTYVYRVEGREVDGGERHAGTGRFTVVR